MTEPSQVKEVEEKKKPPEAASSSETQLDPLQYLKEKPPEVSTEVPTQFGATPEMFDSTKQQFPALFAADKTAAAAPTKEGSVERNDAQQLTKVVDAQGRTTTFERGQDGEVNSFRIGNAAEGEPPAMQLAKAGLVGRDGETYNDVLTAVSLLGNEIPAVSTLDDIVALYASKAKIGFDAQSQVRLALYPGPRRRKAELGTDTSVEDRREAIDKALRDKYGDGINGYGWPWIEETFDAYVVVTRDGRHWKVPFSIGSDGAVSLGSETEVEQTWRPIPPAGSTGETEEEGMADLKRIAAALGLADGATEDQIIAAAKAATSGPRKLTQAECEEKGGKWQEGGTCKMPETQATREDCEAKGGKWNEESSSCEMPAADAKLAKRVVDLERMLARRDAKDAVDAAIRAKKLAPAQREWAETYAAKDPAGFKTYVEKTPEIFAASGATEGDADPAEDDVTRFQAKVEELRKADPKLDLATAQARASREHPELFAAAMGR